MSIRERSAEEGTNTRTDDPPEKWEQTGRQPRLPDGHVGTFETNQGTCLYDREQPGRYIIGQALEIGEHETGRRGSK